MSHEPLHQERVGGRTTGSAVACQPTTNRIRLGWVCRCVGGEALSWRRLDVGYGQGRVRGDRTRKVGAATPLNRECYPPLVAARGRGREGGGPLLAAAWGKGWPGARRQRSRAKKIRT